MNKPFEHQVNAIHETTGSDFYELESFDLSKVDIPEGSKPLHKRAWRLRRVEIAPGGIMGYHGHANRPAILHILQGTATEFHSEFPEPRIREAGSTTIETGDIYHWWRNDGDERVIIIVTDLFDDGIPAEGC